VFVSLVEVDVESEDFKIYDSIKTREQLVEVQLANPGVVPRTAAVFQGEDY
jgi:hypothetical protein